MSFREKKLFSRNFRVCLVILSKFVFKNYFLFFNLKTSLKKHGQTDSCFREKKLMKTTHTYPFKFVLYFTLFIKIVLRKQRSNNVRKF